MGRTRSFNMGSIRGQGGWILAWHDPRVQLIVSCEHGNHCCEQEQQSPCSMGRNAKPDTEMHQKLPGHPDRTQETKPVWPAHTWSEWKLRRFLSNLNAVASSVLLLDGGGLMALLWTAQVSIVRQRRASGFVPPKLTARRRHAVIMRVLLSSSNGADS